MVATYKYILLLPLSFLSVKRAGRMAGVADYEGIMLPCTYFILKQLIEHSSSQ